MVLLVLMWVLVLVLVRWIVVAVVVAVSAACRSHPSSILMHRWIRYCRLTVAGPLTLAMTPVTLAMTVATPNGPRMVHRSF